MCEFGDFMRQKRMQFIRRQSGRQFQEHEMETEKGLAISKQCNKGYPKITKLGTIVRSNYPVKQQELTKT